MHLLCGLGNPEKRYSLTRHNVGFRIINQIIDKYKTKKHKIDSNKETFIGEVDKEKYFLLKPLNYMNNSGFPIQSFANYYKIKSEKIIVIHDDLDLSLGKIKYKKGGGNGGHKGLISIDNCLGKQYNRLRIGIGHPGSKNLVDSYVLKKFKKDEEILLVALIDSIVNNINLLLKNQKDLFLTKIYEEIKKFKI